MAFPEVSVLMPIFNGALFLEDAIESILWQTFGDFELLVINDGSTDRTGEILARYKDPRLHVVNNDRNLGLVASLNRGIGLAKGNFIARADADDISRPQRLETQLAYLREHPGVGVCGTWFRIFGDIKSRIVRPPSKPASVVAQAFFQCPIAHPSVMLRARLFREFSLYYDPGAPHAEDYDLWVRAARHCALANVPRIMLDYRVHGGQISATANKEQVSTSSRIRLEQLVRLFPEATIEQQDWHLRVCENSIPMDTVSLVRARAWLDCLLILNNQSGLFERSAFRGALGRLWYDLSLRVAPEDPRARRIYFSRTYAAFSAEAISLHVRQLLKGFGWI